MLNLTQILFYVPCLLTETFCSRLAITNYKPQLLKELPALILHNVNPACYTRNTTLRLLGVHEPVKLVEILGFILVAQYMKFVYLYFVYLPHTESLLYSPYWTGTILQLRTKQGSFQMQNKLFVILMINSHISLCRKLSSSLTWKII